MSSSSEPGSCAACEWPWPGGMDAVAVTGGGCKAGGGAKALEGGGNGAGVAAAGGLATQDDADFESEPALAPGGGTITATPGAAGAGPGGKTTTGGAVPAGGTNEPGGATI